MLPAAGQPADCAAQEGVRLALEECSNLRAGRGSGVRVRASLDGGSPCLREALHFCPKPQDQTASPSSLRTAVSEPPKTQRVKGPSVAAIVPRPEAAQYGLRSGEPGSSQWDGSGIKPERNQDGPGVGGDEERGERRHRPGPSWKPSGAVTSGTFSLVPNSRLHVCAVSG